MEAEGRNRAPSGSKVRLPRWRLAKWSSVAPSGVVMQGYVFTGIDLTEVVGMPVVREVSAGGKGFHHKVSRIDDGSVVLVQAACAGLVNRGGGAHVQRFVRTFVVELVAPALEAALLGGEIDRRRLGGLGLEVSVHAFMGMIRKRR